MNNGGFHQYWWNSSGDTAYEAVESLHFVGAHRAARIVAAAFAVFPGGRPPRSRAPRQDLVEQLTPEQEDLLEASDLEFFKYPDDLTELLFEYVRRNAADIDGAVEVGIG